MLTSLKGQSMLQGAAKAAKSNMEYITNLSSQYQSQLKKIEE
jgi:hypothetical protein